MNQKKKIGLSLSFCVKDMIENNISFNDVEKIITGTKFESRDSFVHNMLSCYAITYWRKDPDKAIKIALNLWDQGKLEQPRLTGGEPPNLAWGVWI